MVRLCKYLIAMQMFGCCCRCYVCCVRLYLWMTAIVALYEKLVLTPAVAGRYMSDCVYFYSLYSYVVVVVLLLLRFQSTECNLNCHTRCTVKSVFIKWKHHAQKSAIVCMVRSHFCDCFDSEFIHIEKMDLFNLNLLYLWDRWLHLVCMYKKNQIPLWLHC